MMMMMMIMMTIMTKWLGGDFDCFFGVDFDFGYFWGPSCGGPGVSDCEGFQCHSWRAPTPNEPLQVPCGGEADTIVVCMQLHFSLYSSTWTQIENLN